MAGCRCSWRIARKAYRKPGVFVDSRTAFDAAAESMNDLPAERQSDARGLDHAPAMLRPGVVARENVRQYIGGYAGAGIDENEAVLMLAGFKADRDRAFAGNSDMPQRVLQQVEDHMHHEQLRSHKGKVRLHVPVHQRA